MLKNFKIKTKYNEVYDITEHVKKAVEESGVKEGTCLVYNPHSTAGLAVFSPWDPDGFLDLDEEIRRLVPTRIEKPGILCEDSGGCVETLPELEEARRSTQIEKRGE